jgi:glutamate synthase (NADPH/NADH) small chain
VGTSNRHGAASVTQIELMPKPPENENKALTWPYWPAKLRTSSSHEEGADRDWAITTKAIKGEKGSVSKIIGAKVQWLRDEATGQMKMQEVPGSEFDIQADLVLLAMGFVSPLNQMLASFGVDMDARGNASANTEDYQTNIANVFAAGDVRRGQSLVVWAIREGRQCARSVDEFLMGVSELPR